MKIFILIFFFSWFDLLTKIIAKNYLIDTKNLLGDFLYLEYVENIWIAFSMPITWIVLKILTILIIFIIFVYYFKYEKKNNINFIIYWLIFSWAIWNWIERIFNWKVIDFIWIKYFAIFNLADTYISLAVFIYIINYFLNHNKNEILK